LLTLHWLLAGAAVIVALAAWAKARRLAKRLERLTESYWELRYEHGQLRARVNRLDPDSLPAGADASTGGVPATAFVPLSSLKSREPVQK
jgi:hypothetical protein